MTIRTKGARMAPHLRKEQIFSVAIDIAIERGYNRLTRRAIANKIQCAPALVTHYCGGIDDIKNTVLDLAVQREIIPILAQNLAVSGKETATLSPKLKKKVVQYLTN